MNSTTDHLTTTIKTTAAIGAACALGVLLAACGSQTAAHRATPTSSSPTTVAAAPTPALTAPQTAPVTPAATVASTPPTPTPVPVIAVARPTGSPARAAGVPHFATPEAGMRYLVAAYNTGNEANIRHVTTPSSRDQFESERQWVKTFTFRSCRANGAPAWDYTCVLDITTTMPGVTATIDPTTGTQIMNEVTVLVAPAARTGFYLEANQGCGG